MTEIPPPPENTPVAELLADADRNVDRPDRQQATLAALSALASSDEVKTLLRARYTSHAGSFSRPTKLLIDEALSAIARRNPKVFVELLPPSSGYSSGASVFLGKAGWNPQDRREKLEFCLASGTWELKPEDHPTALTFLEDGLSRYAEMAALPPDVMDPISPRSLLAKLLRGIATLSLDAMCNTLRRLAKQSPQDLDFALQQLVAIANRKEQDARNAVIRLRAAARGKQPAKSKLPPLSENASVADWVADADRFVNTPGRQQAALAALSALENTADIKDLLRACYTPETQITYPSTRKLLFEALKSVAQRNPGVFVALLSPLSGYADHAATILKKAGWTPKKRLEKLEYCFALGSWNLEPEDRPAAQSFLEDWLSRYSNLPSVPADGTSPASGGTILNKTVKGMAHLGLDAVFHAIRQLVENSPSDLESSLPQLIEHAAEAAKGSLRPDVVKQLQGAVRNEHPILAAAAIDIHRQAARAVSGEELEDLTANLHGFLEREDIPNRRADWFLGTIKAMLRCRARNTVPILIQLLQSDRLKAIDGAEREVMKAVIKLDPVAGTGSFTLRLQDDRWCLLAVEGLQRGNTVEALYPLWENLRQREAAANSMWPSREEQERVAAIETALRQLGGEPVDRLLTIRFDHSEGAIERARQQIEHDQAATQNERMKAVYAFVRKKLKELLRGRAPERLAFAARKGDLATVKALLAEGLDPRGELGRVALREAVFHGHTTLAKFLAEHGAQLDLEADLFYAAGQHPGGVAPGWHAVLNYLLDQGADPDVRDSARETPLFEAIRRGDVDAVRLLLRRGADPEAAAHRGALTPLSLARSWMEDASREPEIPEGQMSVLPNTSPNDWGAIIHLIEESIANKNKQARH